MSYTKVRGKSVHCVEFEQYNFKTNMVAKFDTTSFPQIFNKIDYRLESCGVCIEPLTAEQREQVRKGIKVKPPQDGFQENTVCLLFYKTKDIDELISALEECKQDLAAKIRARKQEEYRKKYYGKIVKISDALLRRGVRQ